MSKESQAGLNFRQDLMKYMPPGIVSSTTQKLSTPGPRSGRNDHGMVCFYGTLVDPATSKLGDCLAVARNPQALLAVSLPLAASLWRLPAQAPKSREGDLAVHSVGNL